MAKDYTLDAMPKIEVYPVCSVCHVAYVLRYAHVLEKAKWNLRWIWQRDCRHKSMPPMSSTEVPGAKKTPAHVTETELTVASSKPPRRR